MSNEVQPVKPIRLEGGFSDRRETFSMSDPNNTDTAKLIIQYNNDTGKPEEYTGTQAVLNTSIKNPYTDRLRVENPELFIQGQRGKRDYRNTASYSIARKLTGHLTDGKPGFFGKNFNTPFTASVAGAAIGGAGLTLTHWLAKKLGFVDEEADSLWPGLIGAGLGAGLGYFSNKHNVLKKEGSYIEKYASMYQDPRNFILEKLQRSSDLSLADKAMLANKVRNMDRMSATNLEKIVRSALGIGVGAIIAKYFGLGTTGTVLGGLLGAFGANMTGIGNSFFNRY